MRKNITCAAALLCALGMAGGSVAAENSSLAPLTASQPDFILKACKETASTGDTNYLMNGIDPAGMLAVYLGNRSNRDILGNSAALAAIKTTLLEDAKHGEVIVGTRSYQYDPTAGYVGNDKAIFMAEFEGKRYKIIVELHVFDVAPRGQARSPPPRKRYSG
jgi:hypothetical protein